MIREMRREDIESIVSIRKQVMGGLLSELGKDFLRAYYNAVLKEPRIRVKIACDKDSIVGFVTLALETKRLYFDLLRRDPVGFLFSTFSYFVRHPQYILKILETFSYVGFHEDGAEILSIAISSRYQRKGWGSKLFRAAIEEFGKYKISSFRISTYDKDIGANRFYKKIGCVLEESFNFRGEKMNYYRYSIKS